MIRSFLINGDARRLPLADDSVDLVFGSPPYEAARTYGIGFKLKGQDWVDWMVDVFMESLRVCTGLVAFVLEGQTRDFRWSAVPALLMADLHRKGVCLRKPPIYHRVGIPGSGGPDWLRNDWEFIVCATKGDALPWSENTAAGHPPKWAPGGEMAHRLANGARVNQWGPVGGKNGGGGRKTNGEYKPSALRAKIDDHPSHNMFRVTERTKNGTRRAPKGHKDGDTVHGEQYEPPVLANPGNVVKCIVGGGVMGSNKAHENEAPFPEALSDFFIPSFCKPGGLVLDPFSGSGTTGASTVKFGRRYIGLDIRMSQVQLSRRRLDGVQLQMNFE